MRDDREWLALAARQAGAINRAQLLAAGLSDSAVLRRMRNGLLRVVLPGVYVVAGAPDSPGQRRWVAHLAVGPSSILSFETAARIHALPTVGLRGPTVVTVPHSGWQRLPGVRIHQISDVSGRDIESWSGLPVTSARRTIVDLAAIWRRGRMAIVLDDADASGKATYADVGGCLRSVARRGKPGVQLLTALLDERGPGEPPPESVLEASFLSLVEHAGLPEPTRQYALPRDDGALGLADAAWEPWRVIVEVDGRRWHQRIADMKRDRDRDLKAAGEGWQVVRVLHEHVAGAPEETIRELRNVLSVRARQLGLEIELDR